MTPQTAESWEVAFLLAREIVSAGPAGEVSPSGTVLKILLMQLGLGASIALLAWPLAGISGSLHFLLGTLVGVVPNAYLGMRITGFGRSTDARGLMRAAWMGEAGKLGLTVLLLVLVFAFLQPSRPGWLLAGFIAVQLSNWLALILFTRS